MVTKIFKAVLVAFIGGTLLWSITSTPDKVEKEPYDPLIAQEAVQGLSEAEIVNKLVAMYLAHYQSQSLPETEQLTAYNVSKVRKPDNIPMYIETKFIHLGNGDPRIIIYYADYSVQTRTSRWDDKGEYASNYSWMMDGNSGHAEADNWISKGSYFQLLQEAGHYRLKMLPIEPSY